MTAKIEITQEMVERAARLRKQGMSRQEVRRAMGLSDMIYRRVLDKGREQGIIDDGRRWGFDKGVPYTKAIPKRCWENASLFLRIIELAKKQYHESDQQIDLDVGRMIDTFREEYGSKEVFHTAHKRTHKRWRENEKQYLQEAWSATDKTDIAEHLGRPVGSVQAQASSMGLTKKEG